MNEHNSQSSPSSASASIDLDRALAEVESLGRQLDQLKQELVWSNRLTTLGTMSAVLAHEYNNLLTPIGSYAQLALANPGDQALVRKALDTAVEGVRQAQSIAQATLGFARPSDREHPASASLSETVKQCLQYAGKTVERDSIELEIDVPEAHVALGPTELQQVLVNLIENARKAMAGQRTRRRLTVSASPEQGGWRIDVADTGPGFPDGLGEDAFEAFTTRPTNKQSGAPSDGSSEGSSGGRSGGGTGLGLRICKDLVESAGGWIRVEPCAPGSNGATLRFWLPAGG